MQRHQIGLILIAAVLLTGFLFARGIESTAAPPPEVELPRGSAVDYGPAPRVPDGPPSAEVLAAVDSVFGEAFAEGLWSPEQTDALRVISGAGDPRYGWLISDLMRIASDRQFAALMRGAATELLGIDLAGSHPWNRTTNHLIAWDIPAPPDYLQHKRAIYTLIEPAWSRLFVPGDVDWRLVSWGGVGIDDRPFGKTEDVDCGCIPAADNPPVSAARHADWLADDDVVFGIHINGESRAYPRRIMEVREMVNDRLGGRDLGIPYCTLCGSVQAWFTDRLPGDQPRAVLRTSGLLSRSNKLMYELTTYSVFDTFTGRGLTGPLRGVQLEQTGVVTTTWGEWRRDHPETTVLIEALALGRDFDFRNNRDADGPIFPIGDVDPRLPVQEDVFGVITPDGDAVAMHVETALQHLRGGGKIAFDGVRISLDGGGLRARDADGEDLGGHQAFWFAWSQFHPQTRIWPPRAP